MFGRLMKISALVLLCLITILPEAKAQDPLLDSKVTVFERPYEPLTTTIWSSSNYWFRNTRFSGLPWPIIYDGKSFTRIIMYSHGAMMLSNSNSTPSMTPISRSTQDYLDRYNYYCIYPFWVTQDGRTTTGEDGWVKVGLQGTAPDRVLIFEWYNQDLYRYNVHESSDLNYQVRFYEKDNAIEICYGNMNRGNKNIGIRETYGYERILIGFTAQSAKENWINIDPNGNGNTGYKNWEAYYKGSSGSGGHSKYSTVRDNTDFAELTSGTVIRLGAADPTIAQAWPDEDAILVRPNQYGNSGNPENDVQKPGVVVENVEGAALPVQYEISGPISFPAHPNYQTIYSWSGNLANGETRFGSATGPGAGPAGSLHLGDASIKGGLYHLNASIDDSEEIYVYEHFFYIANTIDIEIAKAIAPRDKNSWKYPLTARVPLKLQLINRGITSVTAFDAEINVYNEDGGLIKTESLSWEAEPGQELELGETLDLEFNPFQPASVGEYKFEAQIKLLGDEELSNNTLPWSGQKDHIFVVAPEIEAEARGIIIPNNVDDLGRDVEIYVGRPIVPQARFANLGITDISDAPATMTITRLSDNIEDYVSSVVITDIPQGMSNNKSDAYFDEYAPSEAGTYEVCVTVDPVDDWDTQNNTFCQTFEVVNALSGVYTIGPNQNTGDQDADKAYNARNFVAIADALDELYQRGVTGPVVFEFTSDYYVAGDMTLQSLNPSLDLRSKIIGVNETNTVTFRPSALKSVSSGSVNIHLYSGSGIGVIFGQATTVTNQYAVANNVPADRVKNYANSAGYIIFDGGMQKSLKFTLHTDAALNAVFYLSQGASNLQIKNCIINNANPMASMDDYLLPLTSFNDPQFKFDQDSRNSGLESYSAAIVMRSIPPQDDINFFDPNDKPEAAINSYNLDTLVNRNNIVENNDISGFAYGMVSLGIGPLMKDGIPANYYNTDNEFLNNYIHDVSRAGIFLGHEKNSLVNGNKISGVASAATGFNEGIDVAGIIAGGDKREVKMGYNNIGLTIMSNEISNVGEAINSVNMHSIYGIKIEQCRNSYHFTYFPDEYENTKIINNVIWGLRSASALNSRCGIRLMTERNLAAGSWEEIMISPMDGRYFTRNDKVVNNTIIIGDDGYNTSGAVAGIAIQQSSETGLVNNAIAMLDDNSSGATNTYAAVFYQGTRPGEEKGILSDRNVYWLHGDGAYDDQAALYRFVYTGPDSEELYLGERNEFSTMNQWRMYNGSQDFNSSIDNFVEDLTNPNVNDPESTLRIDTESGMPVGSKLNNLGEKLDYVLWDIDGNERGKLGQRYDIGAFEFSGVLLNSDIEVTTSNQPGAYKSTSSAFSDAEHIMTIAPVEIKAELRNNGSLYQSGINATVRIYRENPDGGFYEEPELEESVKSNIMSMESNEISFNLADGKENEFYPLTYTDLNLKNEDNPDLLYDIPEKYKTMAVNVTPLYRIVISVQADEDVSNNVYTKDVRFYLKRSMLNMLMTAENSYFELSPASSDDELAGRRNYDSLKAFLDDLGFESLITKGETDTTMKIFYDIFERNSWEPRAVDYTLYRTLLWSDGHENALSRYEILDIEKFAESGNTEFKKNLIIGSQEMSRSNFAQNEEFVKSILRADHKDGYPTDPLDGVSYNAGATQPAYTLDDPGKYIVGDHIGRLLKQYIMKTGLDPRDPDPLPGLMSVWEPGAGLARTAYRYNEDVTEGPEPKETSMGTSVTTLTRNVVYLGVDWRHFEKGEDILRATLDFLNKNGSEIIPVELVSFNAEGFDNRVELSWTTASELNSDRFEVERAVVNEGAYSMFTKIAEEDAAGKSSKLTNYGPVIDKNVEFGTNYAYRLKMIDLDGQYDYSDAVEVDLASDVITLSEATPNPATTQAEINYTLGEAGNIEISIYDLSGKKVMTVFSGFSPEGMNSLTMDLSALQNGLYNYVLQTGDNFFAKQIRIVK